MAVARLGMIITEMAGSIGGTTIKRQGGNLSLYNKSRGANKSILYQNKGLGRMNDVRARWHGSDLEYKDAWDKTAADFTFPDKFGNQKNITGYQLYTKSSNALAIVGNNPINAANYDQSIKQYLLGNFQLNKNDRTCSVQIEQGGGRQWYLIAFDVSTKFYKKPIYNKRLILYSWQWDDVGVVNIDDVFWDKYGYISADSNVRIYVTPMNPHGYKGVTEFRDAIVS